MANLILDEIVEYLLEPPPEPLTAAERTRQWRARRKADGIPEAKVADLAIAEAVSYLTSVAVPSPATNAEDGPVSGYTAMINGKDIMRIATIILYRDGYARQSSKKVVIARMAPREYHDSFAHMPSRKPHPNRMLIEPPAGGGAGWTDKDYDYMARIAGKTFSRD